MTGKKKKISVLMRGKKKHVSASLLRGKGKENLEKKERQDIGLERERKEECTDQREEKGERNTRQRKSPPLYFCPKGGRWGEEEERPPFLSTQKFKRKGKYGGREPEGGVLCKSNNLTEEGKRGERPFLLSNMGKRKKKGGAGNTSFSL